MFLFEIVFIFSPINIIDNKSIFILLNIDLNIFQFYIDNIMKTLYINKKIKNHLREGFDIK